MVKALAGMQHLVLAQTAAADGFFKIPEGRLVALHLLRRHHKIKLHRRQLLPGFGKKIVINVGDNPQPEPPSQRLQCRQGIDEWLPARERTRKSTRFVPRSEERRVGKEGRSRWA